MARIDAFFKLMHEHNASDLHLLSGSQPMLRIHGELQKVKYHVLEETELRTMLYEIITEQQIRTFEETGDLDFAYEVAGLARYRANYFMHKDGIGAAFREIPNKIMTIDELGLPQVLKSFALLPKGFVLVTGPTGSGKSTTLAAIIDYANEKRKSRIITIEDPIEFVHTNRNCVITHREVGAHTKSFAAALRSALREDPDIILVGEIRDLETARLAMEAAATGHLVFSTLHTVGATKTIDRLVEMFPPEEQNFIRSLLADVIRGVISQTLFKRIDQPGRVAALEIMVATYGVRNLIRENKTYQLPSLIQTGKKYGMQTLDDAIMELLTKGWIDPEDAYLNAIDKSKFRPFLKRMPKDFTEV
ncbi:MAG: type IV pilus twitching motility protein PilT [Candidatus Desulfofervidus auxilii]|nr:type IV pilus twitching motility protein PilT [Candidatus Desulfofervidus auxilii]